MTYKKNSSKNYLLFLSSALLFLSLYFSPFLSAQEAAIHAGRESEFSDKPIMDQVKLLRAQRYAEIPYLSKSFINSQIRPEKVKAKTEFISSGPKQLKDILDRAAKVYTPARSARERIALARRRILVAVRNLFPEATYEYVVKRGALSGDGFNGNNYRFNFRQAIFHGGALWNTLLQEKMGLESSEKEYQATLEDLASDVSEAYFEYQRALQAVKDRKAAIEKLKSFVDISNQKYQSQLISEIEYLNAQSLYSQLQYEHETSKQELELAKLELQKYLDLEITDNLTVEPLYNLEALLEQFKPKQNADLSASPNDLADAAALMAKEEIIMEGDKKVPTLNELVDLSYQNRAKLKVEAAKLESARLNEKIKWGGMLPQVDLILEMGKAIEAFNVQDMDPNLKPEFKASIEMNWNLGGSKVGYTYDKDERAPSVSQFASGAGTHTSRSTISVGLLDGLGDFVSVKEAEVEKLDQVVALEKAEKEVVHDVKQAYFDYQKARIQMKSSFQRANYRKRLAQYNKHRMEKNEVQISEYIESENEFVQESMTLHKALADYFVAKAKINHAIGIRDYLPVEDLNVRASEY